MTYRINKTDGNLLAEIPDGTFDTVNSSLTLIGKNVTSFGESLNENLVKLLENFASSSAPENPIKGQLWYDTTTGRLNVYDGSDFRASGGPLISASRPNNLVAGDLWINNETKQIWFYDGVTTTLAGPLFTAQQRPTGFIVESVIDRNNRQRVIAKLFVGGILLGVFSNIAFTPANTAIPSWPILQPSNTALPIGVGFTANTNVVNNKFDIVVTKAEGIITEQGEIKVASDLVFSNEDATINGSLTVQSIDGLRLLGGDPGTNVLAQGDSSLRLEGGNFIIENNEAGRSVQVVSKNPLGGSNTAIYIDAINQRLGLFNTAPTATVDITGDLKISGNFIVEGQTFAISATNLEVQDKNIELNKSTSGAVTDLQADGGGITLKATVDKTLTYSFTGSSWSSSENFNLAANKVYKIENTEVLSKTTLGNTVINSSLINLGNLVTLNMSNGLNITQNTIEAKSGDLVLTSNTGDIDVGGKTLKNIANLNFLTSSPTDVANKAYVDERTLVRPLALTIDISDFNISTQPGMEAANNFIVDTLNAIAPIYDAVNNPEGTSIAGTVAKILASKTEVVVDPIIYKPVVDNGTTPGSNETEAFTRVDVAVAQDLGGGNYQVIGTTPVVQDLITYQTIAAPAASVSVTRIYKRFKVVTNPGPIYAWEFITDYQPKGVWSVSTAYVENDLVSYLGKEYICLAPITGGAVPSSNPVNWTLFSII